MFQKVAGTALANVVIAGTGLTSGVLAARWLGPEGRGVLAAVQALPLVVAGLSTLGMPEAIAYRLASGEDRRGAAFGSAIALSLLSGALLGAATYFVVPWFLPVGKQREIGLAHLYLWIIPLSGLLNTSMGSLRGLNRLQAWNVIRVMPGAMWLLALVATSRLRLGVGALLTFQLLGLAAIGLLVMLPICLREVRTPIANAEESRALLRFGVPITLAVAPQIFGMRFDQLILARVSDAREIGLYAVVVTFGGLVSIATSAIGLVVMPELARCRESQRKRRTIRLTLALAVLTAGIGTACLLMVGQRLIPMIFGSGYVSAYGAAWPAIVGCGVLAVNGVSGEVLRGLGRPKSVLRTEVGTLIAVVAAIALLPTGPMGVGTGMAIGQSVGLLLYFSAVCKAEGAGWRECLLVRAEDLRSLRFRPAKSAAGPAA